MGEVACGDPATCLDPHEDLIWDQMYAQLQSTPCTSPGVQSVAGPAMAPLGVGPAACCHQGPQLSEQPDLEFVDLGLDLEAKIASDLAEKAEVGSQPLAAASSTFVPLTGAMPRMSPWQLSNQAPGHIPTPPVFASQPVSSTPTCLHLAMASQPVTTATGGQFQAAAAAAAPPPPDSGTSCFLSRQAAPGLPATSMVPIDLGTVPGHQAPSSSAALLSGQLTSAGSIGSGASCTPEATSIVTPASPAGASGSICLQCILLQQACINLAATWPANSKVPHADKLNAMQLLVAAAACPQQCLIAAQLPISSCCGSTDMAFAISVAKARLAGQGGQRAPPGTALGRNLNLNCNAPCRVEDSSIPSLLGLRGSDKLFTVVSSDRKSGLTAIALARLPGDPPPPEDCSCSDSSVSSSTRLEHLWCSGGIKCTNTKSQYKGMVFDLFMYALFLKKKQAMAAGLAGTKQKSGASR